jgi:two-component system chemotaxis response regulator CheB
METLPRLEAGFGVPILIVQHMPARFTASLADDLDRSCSLHVCEAKNGQLVEAGTVYIAPGGRHMRFRRRGDQIVTTITDDLPEKSCRPSIDYMFRSVADVWGANSLGVVMTGMGNDGSDGSRSLRESGAHVWAQNEESCVIYGMPRVVIEAGLADKVYSLNQIPVELNRTVARGAVPCS